VNETDVDVLEGDDVFEVVVLKDWVSGNGVPSLLCCVEGAVPPEEVGGLAVGGR